MRQYTITENNDWEGEIWGYIINLTEDQYELLNSKMSEDENMPLSIEPTDHTEEFVEKVNKHSYNIYMDSLSFMKFKSNFDFNILKNLKGEEFWNCFYKANCLENI